MQRRLTGVPATARLETQAGACLARSAERPVFDCVGPFSDQASDASIATRFGAGNVVCRKVAAGEGETAMRTVIFPRDPALRLEIEWRDETRAGGARPRRVAEGDGGGQRQGLRALGLRLER